MKKVSIVVPVFNEEKNIGLLFEEVQKVFAQLPNYSLELIFVDDGSRDQSLDTIKQLAQNDQSIKYIEFSRNFGKEVATSCGIHHATGDAVMCIDADLQHPVGLIPDFLQKWEAGTDVVIGVRTKNNGTTKLKKFAGKVYYKIINAISTTPIIPGATDFRLMDRKVVNVFNKLTEHERMTRGLIDWLGFRRDIIEFVASERANGTATYSYLKLIKLAISSTVSHSLVPLKFAGYLGMFVTIFSFLGGVVVFVNRYIFNDYMEWHASGSAQLAILLVFFVGIILSCLGLIALYIGNIIHEVTARPLYVVRDTNFSKYENLIS